MTEEDRFTVEPWCLREARLRFGELASTETVFALSNGNLGIRGTLDEGDPVGMSGTYLAGLHELRTMVYTESGNGDPEATQTLVNTIDGTPIRLSVDGRPLDVRTGELHHHERVLDLRAGTLARELRWGSPAGRVVDVRSERLVSLVQPGAAAIRYSVRAVDEPVEIVLTSSLVANGQQPRLGSHPGAEDLLRHPLVGDEHRAQDRRLTLLHHTRRTGSSVAAVAEHLLDGPAEVALEVDSDDDWARLVARTRLEPGQELTVVKLLGYAWSADRPSDAVRDEAAAAVAAAAGAGWTGLLDAQRAHLDDFWADADVEMDGDDQLQQAVRFALWHLLQASARSEGHGIAGKALTGTGYEGHVFWDTETFVLQAMTALRPEATRRALSWRHSTLDKARDRAGQLALRGASFPWRTIGGEECSGYWPAGSAALHVNADIAEAAVRYVEATGDDEFARTTGLDLLVETARLWASAGNHGRDGRFHILGVTGPDEYSALADDNVYTNLMAQLNLLRAVRWARAHPDGADRLGVDADEIDSWQAAGTAMALPYDADLGVHPQSAGFTHQPRWNFAAMAEDDYPLHSHFPYLQLYRQQVIKQADLVLAMHLRGDAFSAEEKARNFAYYEGVTVRDSSLSACCQAVLAAEVGHLGLAHDYVAESALADLRDVEHDSSDGLHLAALAGTWIALVAGFGGLRQVEGGLRFRPALPEALTRFTFRLRHRGRRLRVTVVPGEVEYVLVSGEPLTVHHEDAEIELVEGAPVTRSTTPPPDREPPDQPPTRRLGRRANPPAVGPTGGPEPGLDRGGRAR